eukprot:scaffold3705_cov32-Cyclotella_meneghiniana.AAC.1
MCVGGGGMSGKVVAIHGVVLALLEVLAKMGRTTHGRDGRRLQFITEIPVSDGKVDRSNEAYFN